jgi:hypothetical protein
MAGKKINSAAPQEVKTKMSDLLIDIAKMVLPIAVLIILYAIFF